MGIATSGVERVEFGTTEVVFNDSGEDIDLRIEGDDEPNLLVVNAGNNRIGIGESAPGTLVEIVSEAPYVTLKNSTEEDTDGGRESRLIFEGEQSGGEISTLARIEVSHDGAADDQKGKLVISTNTGVDGASPTAAIAIDSSQQVGIGTTSPAVDLDVSGEIRASTGILFGTDTAAANTLDDYEEGTWTPTFIGATTAGSYTFTSNAWYTKIGDTVTAYAELINITDSSLGSGQLNVGGLPFTNGAKSALGSVLFSSFNVNDSTVNITAFISAGQSVVKFFETLDNTSLSGVNVTDRVDDTADLYLQVTYKVT